ncbi:MAG: polysaccharide deacetylase family protein [Oscillospiraceae bacterium]|nr:polysaccharide deacetylase family protein [Oscillospiraceae bacterium]
MKRCIALILCLILLRLPTHAAEQEKLVALTFDDGPSGRYTQRLLDGLEERNVKATFLLCGYRMEQYPTLTQKIYQLGHEIGLHGYSHKTLQHTCRQGAQREIQKAMELIPDGCEITFFRSPGGLCSKDVLEVAKEWELSMLLWSVDPKDWAVHDAAAITKSVVDRVKDGDIILLHDMSDSSVDAAFTIIDQLQEQGYRFVTASQLAAEKNITPRPGIEYRRFGA